MTLGEFREKTGLLPDETVLFVEEVGEYGYTHEYQTSGIGIGYQCGHRFSYRQDKRLKEVIPAVLIRQ